MIPCNYCTNPEPVAQIMKYKASRAQPTMLCRAFTGPMQALYRLSAQGPYRFGRRGYSGPVQAAYTGYVVARTV